MHAVSTNLRDFPFLFVFKRYFSKDDRTTSSDDVKERLINIGSKPTNLIGL